MQSDTAIKPPKTGEFGHIGLYTLDIQKSIEVTAEGGDRTICKNLIDDPWGTRIQFIQSNTQGFHHVLINCTDPSASARWYALNLGGEVVTCPWDRGYLAVQYDTMWMTFGQNEKVTASHPDNRPICHIGWYTDDIESTAKRMISTGCHFPVPVRPFGTVQLAFAEDPSGLWVELVEPPGGKLPK